MKSGIQTNRYKELDALRGIAALVVVFFHFTMGRPEANLGFRLGITGVDLFFIISGFVIFMSLTKVKTSMDFVINRVSRLYPTYWTCVTFTFLLITILTVFKLPGFVPISIRDYLGNLTMFQFYLKITDIDGPYWTMIIEMTFYIGILFLFHFKGLRFLNFIGISLSISVVILATFFSDVFLIKKTIMWIQLLQYIPLFFAGTIFYKIYTLKSKLIENYIIIAICLTAQILMYSHAGKYRNFISQTEYGILLVIYFTFFSLFVNGKLLFVVSKVTLFLGKISFALYLIHQFISTRVIIPFLTIQLHINFWVASIFITLPIVIILASIVTYYIEVPLSKKMKEKLRSLHMKTKIVSITLPQ